MVYSSRETTNVAFWQDRLKRADIPLTAIGTGFDWPKIDDLHRKFIFSNTESNPNVLDVGCGIGRVADWFDDDSYVGFDFVPEFIEIAKKSHPNKTFLIHSIVEPLPFETKEFDLAILISVRVPLRVNIGETIWDKEVEVELKRVAKKVIILEYGNNDPEEIRKYSEIL